MNSNRNLKVESSAALPQYVNLKRLLIVEDNNLNRLMLNDYLIFCGYNVMSLACGANLLKEVVSFQPHLILLDLKLPGMDGYILLEQLQLNPQGRHIPVIVVSACAFKADRQRAMNLGARQYFIKPVNLISLKQAIEQEIAN